MRDSCKAKETLLSKDCENDMYMTRNTFLRYMEQNGKVKNEEVCENYISSCF